METGKTFLSLDIRNPAEQAVLKFSKFENAREIRIILTREGIIERPQDGFSALLCVKKPDGTAASYAGMVNRESGEITVPVTQQLTAASGRVECQLVLSSKTGEILCAPAFAVLVLDTVVSDIDLASTDEFPALVTAYNGINDYAARLAAAESALTKLAATVDTLVNIVLPHGGEQ